jgi:hypothetical protein
MKSDQKVVFDESDQKVLGELAESGIRRGGWCEECQSDGMIVPWAESVRPDGTHVVFGLPHPDWENMRTGEHFLCLCCSTSACPHPRVRGVDETART